MLLYHPSNSSTGNDKKNILKFEKYFKIWNIYLNTLKVQKPSENCSKYKLYLFSAQFLTENTIYAVQKI